MVIDLDNDIWTMGNNDYGQLGLGDTHNRLIPTKIPNIKTLSVSCGDSHTQ
jgi:alpha-tubulin suppressor-like RCC1 family protein